MIENQSRAKWTIDLMWDLFGELCAEASDHKVKTLGLVLVLTLCGWFAKATQFDESKVEIAPIVDATQDAQPRISSRLSQDTQSQPYTCVISPQLAPMELVVDQAGNCLRVVAGANAQPMVVLVEQGTNYILAVMTPDEYQDHLAAEAAQLAIAMDTAE